jgi:hypothetical protein
MRSTQSQEPTESDELAAVAMGCELYAVHLDPLGDVPLGNHSPALNTHMAGHLALQSMVPRPPRTRSSSVRQCCLSRTAPRRSDPTAGLQKSPLGHTHTHAHTHTQHRQQSPCLRWVQRGYPSGETATIASSNDRGSQICAETLSVCTLHDVEVTKTAP